ncbi:short-chain fatty acyl-CoA regulator family protein [Tsukamurella strandjordii]|uniref:Short-chain fatty acyl-CoA regulator family protein n=1 Tax=Tsukamurella strandjordii TaxID=147577 RepID=A0AA90NDS0_9ACTN|nr:short-chain fatty acyl-CoA regulator family protein [Tsukamurella strandjordii]MDP0396495.1 short-chain fatty acyl-CoA regulator family protein [Tsukamurella strandjordii]
MQRLYVGPRLKRLRDERGLTQTALAKALGLSVSYINQLENDQRPLSVPVLMRLNTTFDLDMAFFAAESDARLVADLQDALVENGEAGDVGPAELDDLVARSPAVARAMVAMHRQLRGATEQVERLSTGVSAGGAGGAVSTPYEDVRDFFYDHRNHIPVLDIAAEELFDSRGLTVGGLDLQLARLLRDEHGVTVRIGEGEPDRPGPRRSFDAESGVLTLARRLDHGQRAFQIATQLAFLTQSDAMEGVIGEAGSLPTHSRALARVGLANYFAGALVLPYERFLRAAEELRYDVDLLGARFEVGFETVCHRLSTLQRPGRRGVPFFLVRTDRAGNISKRQSATAFHFSRVGGSCPLWVVHDAFATPGRIRTQVAQMPDGRSYLWVARTTSDAGAGYLGQGRDFAVGLGCDLAHAHRLVYSRGLALDDPESFTPIGAGCKVCDRPRCAQRAFPQLGRPIAVDPNRAEPIPYTFAGAAADDGA